MAGRASLAEVEAGLQHIIADVIVHDKATCDLVRDLQRQARIELQVKKATAAAAAGTAAKAKKEKAATAKAAAKPSSKGKSTEEEARKFENYFNFCCPVTYVKPHQVLAINRGESLKVLSVKVSLPDSWLLGALERHVRTRQALPFIRRSTVMLASEKENIELTSVADSGCLSRIPEFFPSRFQGQKDPGSGSASKNLSIFNPKNCLALGNMIRDFHPGSGP